MRLLAKLQVYVCQSFSSLSRFVLLLTASRTIPKLNLEVRCQENSNSRPCVHLLFITLVIKFSPFRSQIWREREKKSTEVITAREGRAKVLFLLIKYAKFVALSLPSRRRS